MLGSKGPSVSKMEQGMLVLLDIQGSENYLSDNVLVCLRPFVLLCVSSTMPLKATTLYAVPPYTGKKVKGI